MADLQFQSVNREEDVLVRAICDQVSCSRSTPFPGLCYDAVLAWDVGRGDVALKLGSVIAPVVAALCAAPVAGAASPGLWFELTRTPEAAVCPDASKLARTVEALFDPHVVRVAASRKEASLHVAIAIEKADEGYAAVLRVENETWSERRIVDTDAACRGLPEALAVAIVLLIEPDARAQRRRAEPGGVSEASPRRALPPIFLSVGAGGLFGTGLLGELGSPTFGGSLGATITRGAAGFRVRGARLLRPARAFAEGTLEFDAWAVLFGPCWRIELPRRWEILPCAELGLGAQRGAARDFDVSDSDSAAWRVLATSVTLAVPLSEWIRATGSAGGAFRLHKQNYLIDDQPAEIQPAFAPFLGLGLELRWKIVDGG